MNEEFEVLICWHGDIFPKQSLLLHSWEKYSKWLMENIKERWIFLGKDIEEGFYWWSLWVENQLLSLWVWKLVSLLMVENCLLSLYEFCFNIFSTKWSVWFMKAKIFFCFLLSFVIFFCRYSGRGFFLNPPTASLANGIWLLILPDVIKIEDLETKNMGM